MHFPVMVIFESGAESDLIDLLAPYNENLTTDEFGDNPLSKWDYYGFGGRWTAILNGETWCYLKDFPRVRNEDSEAVLKEKFPQLYELWLKYDKTPLSGSDAFLKFIKTKFCYALLSPSGEWFEPGRRYAWWLGASAGKEEDIDWVEEFNKIMDGYPGDYYVQLIDCHI